MVWYIGVMITFLVLMAYTKFEPNTEYSRLIPRHRRKKRSDIRKLYGLVRNIAFSLAWPLFWLCILALAVFDKDDAQ